MDVLIDIATKPDRRVTKAFVGEEITECLPDVRPAGDRVEGDESGKGRFLLGHWESPWLVGILYHGPAAVAPVAGLISSFQTQPGTP